MSDGRARDPGAFAPLAGIEVLDLSRHLPGPYLTRLLRDLGANVIKLEAPSGDPVRMTPPAVGEHSAAFAALNWGKRSLVIDLKKPHAADIALALAERADVVVESFRPGVLTRLGLGWDHLHARNPKTILCSLSGYGQHGPLADRAGHDINYAARAGILSLWATVGGAPPTPGLQLADLVGGGLQGAVGILAALREREQTGRGRHLDVALCRGLAPLLSLEVPQRGAGWRPEGGQGALTGGLPCYRVYATADGRAMALGALEPKFFMAFCQAVGVEHLAAKGLVPDPDVIAELEALFASRTQSEWIGHLVGVDCCCEPVQTIEEALADPGVGLQTVDVRGVTGVATHVGVECPEAETTVPVLGADSHAILEQAGVDPALIARAVESGALPSATST